MTPRLRRFIAMIGVVVFLAAWIWGAIAVRGLLPAGPLFDLLVFAVAGLAWGAPLYPLFRWAEGGAQKR